MTYERPSIPVDDRVLPKRLRRLQVVALYGSYAAGSAAYAAGLHREAPFRFIALAVVLGAFAVGAWAFYGLTRRSLINAPNIRDADLDERYRERGRDATRRAYFTLGALCTLVPLYVEIATSAERWTWMRNPTLAVDLAWALFLLALTLPQAIMAWTEPDLEDDSAG